jgi:hypothetical protein
MASMSPVPTPTKGSPAKSDPTARTEMPVQRPGEVERREQDAAQQKNQKPVIPPHTAADVVPSDYMDREEIARMAYSYWLERQHSDGGSPDEDWLRAENELRGRMKLG